MENNNNWSEQVDAHETYHTPPGTFTQNADEIVNTLLQGADDDPKEALRRLVFYMNRAGKKLTNREELDKAKQRLEVMEKY